MKKLYFVPNENSFWFDFTDAEMHYYDKETMRFKQTRPMHKTEFVSLEAWEIYQKTEVVTANREQELANNLLHVFLLGRGINNSDTAHWSKNISQLFPGTHTEDMIEIARK